MKNWAIGTIAVLAVLTLPAKASEVNDDVAFLGTCSISINQFAPVPCTGVVIPHTPNRYAFVSNDGQLSFLFSGTDKQQLDNNTFSLIIDAAAVVPTEFPLPRVVPGSSGQCIEKNDGSNIISIECDIHDIGGDNFKYSLVDITKQTVIKEQTWGELWGKN